MSLFRNVAVFALPLAVALASGTVAGAQTGDAAVGFLTRAISACDDIRSERTDADGARRALGLSEADETGMSHGLSSGEGAPPIELKFRLGMGGSGETVSCGGVVSGVGLSQETLKAHVVSEVSRVTSGSVVTHAEEAAIGERGRQTTYVVADQIFLLVRSDAPDPTVEDAATTVMFVKTWMAPVG